MGFNATESERMACDDGRVYELLGPMDTRTATHLILGRTAIPLRPSGCRNA